MTGAWAIDWVRGVTIHGAGWLALAPLLAWLLLGESFAGRRAWRAFRAALAAGLSDARLRFYRQWTWQGWLLAAITLVLALGILGWTPDQLGLRMPKLPTGSLGSGFIVGAAGAAIVGLLLGMVMAKHRVASGQTTPPPKLRPTDDTLTMLPATGRERRGWALLALTAGITEEVIWRGFLLAVLVAIFPVAPAWLLLMPMALLFGFAHLYQGRNGVILTTILGAILGGIYIATASLVVPIILHALIDLRVLLMPPPRSNGA